MVMPLWDDNPFSLPRFPFVTWGLVIANVTVFVLQAAAPSAAQLALNALVLVPGAVSHGMAAPNWHSPYVTLVTYMFLHANFMHLLGNMIFLAIFGDDVEEAMGPLRFFVFYFLCGILAGLAFVVSTPESNVPLVGASGAIAGILAAYLMFRPCQKVAVFIPWFVLWLFVRPVVKIDAVWVLGFWVLTQFWAISVQSQDGVAYMAHIGGLAAGAVLFPLMRYRTVQLFQCVRPGDVPARTGPWG
jgi:membrane associated rhomboid family serine protease